MDPLIMDVQIHAYLDCQHFQIDNITSYIYEILMKKLEKISGAGSASEEPYIGT